jgi:lipopolysaccharide export system protein LptC
MPAAPALSARRPRPGLVAILRVLFPALAAAVLLAVVISAVSGMVRSAARRSAATQPIELTAPRMIGEDGKKRPFVITASTAEREGATNRIRLVQPVLVRDPGTPQQTRVTAQSGVYDQTAGRLELAGDVKLTGPSGDFATPAAVYDAKTGEVLGRGVQAAGRSGQMKAGSFSANDKGDSVVFKGGVRSRINPK